MKRTDMRVYAVTDRHWLNGETLYSQVEKALEGGATFIQLREKKLDEESFLKEAIEIQKLCKKHHVPFVINDNVDIALKINAGGEVSEGLATYSRAIIAVTDRLVKPEWWDYKDLYDGEYSSVDWYYLGDYSDTKYRLFLKVLQENDDVLFDGKDKVKLRKYSLQLKYMVEEINAGRDPDDPLRDETGAIIEIPVVG